GASGAGGTGSPFTALAPLCNVRGYPCAGNRETRTRAVINPAAERGAPGAAETPVAAVDALSVPDRSVQALAKPTVATLAAVAPDRLVRGNSAFRDDPRPGRVVDPPPQPG